MSDNSFIVVCPKCGQKNRYRFGGGAGPVCGRCKSPLAEAIADVIMKVAQERRTRRHADFADELKDVASRYAEEKRSKN
jgi:hypothetical protein